MGLAHYIQDKTRKGRELIDWYLAIWRGEKEPLGRIPKPAERFEAAETLLAYGWGRPPQYVDLALASTEVRRIDVTFDAAPLEGNASASSMVVDVKLWNRPKRARRQIDLLPLTVDALRQHYVRQAEHRLMMGAAYSDQGLVCPAADGSLWWPDRLSDLFASTMKRLDLPRIRFHDLRHTHATHLLREGINPKIVSETARARERRLYAGHLQPRPPRHAGRSRPAARFAASPG